MFNSTAMNVRGAVLNLKGGGHIAYDEYGDAQGVPVIFCHGWPSSRSMAQLTDEAARRLKVRVISPDRPGINDSSLPMQRALLDWPGVLEELLEHLGLENFHMLAISGGAPYAFVTALAMPERVRAIAVVSGAPPIAELKNHAGLWRLHRWMLRLQGKNPAFLRALFRAARPVATMRMSLRYRPFLRLALQRMDAEALRDQTAFEACFDSSRRAWRASLPGVIADAEIYARPWGFRLEEIRTPVRLWHGTKDRTFNFRLAETIAGRLPHCHFELVEGAGHYSLPIRYAEQILSDLIAIGGSPSAGR